MSTDDTANPAPEAETPQDLDAAMAMVDGMLSDEPERPTSTKQDSDPEDPEANPDQREPADDQPGESEDLDEATAGDADLEADADAEAQDADAILDEDAGEEPDKLYTVTIDGQEEKVTLNEALSGYQRQSDYQRKTAELAEMRQSHETKTAEQTQALTERFELADGLLAKALESLGVAEPPNPDLLDETKDVYDPQTYELQKARFEQSKGKIDGLVDEITGAREKLKAQTEQGLKQARQREGAMLRRSWPSLDKAMRAGTPEGAAKAKRLLGTVKNYLVNQGFSEDQVKGIVDHRQILLARKAMHYDRSLENGKNKVGEVRSKPKMTGKRPNAAQERISAASEKRRSSRQQLRKTGSRTAALDFVDSLLG